MTRGIIEAWRSRRHSPALRELNDEYARVVRARNDAIHEILATRQSAQREMQRVALGDVLEGQAWEE